MASGIEIELIHLVMVFIVAGGVGAFVAKFGDFPYTVALLITGMIVGILGIDFGIELSHDIIILVLLPPLLFEGAATTDFEKFKQNGLVIGVLAVVGLIISILFLGFVWSYLFDYPVLIAILFATIILPTDPVSVLALFEELGAPERISTLVEGESLINDGVSVVIFSTIVALLQDGATFETLTEAGELMTVIRGIAFSTIGGAAVGLVVGYAVYAVMKNLDDHMTEIIFTIIIAYGSFLLSEHYLGFSGVIATVAAGMFIGNRGADYAMSPQTKISVFNTWSTAAFVVNTFLFVVIGAVTPVWDIIRHWQLLIPAIFLVLIARALAVYPVTNTLNLFTDTDTSYEYQHVMWWGGLHASIPIALALGIPKSITYREEIRVLVFGVAAFSLVVQGMSIKWLLNRLGITTKSEAARTYDLLVGRAKAVDAALEAVEGFKNNSNIPEIVYQEFVEEYSREKEELRTAISNLLKEYPDINEEQRLMSERKVLKKEKSALISAIRDGSIPSNIGEELIQEVNIKIEQVNEGESTVVADSLGEEQFEEEWRIQAKDMGLIEDDEE